MRPTKQIAQADDLAEKSTAKSNFFPRLLLSTGRSLTRPTPASTPGFWGGEAHRYTFALVSELDDQRLCSERRENTGNPRSNDNGEIVRRSWAVWLLQGMSYRVDIGRLFPIHYYQGTQQK